VLIGVLSDTHLEGDTRKLKKLLLGPLGEAEVLLHCGDHASLAVVEYLTHIEPRPYYGVRGNMDQGQLAEHLPIKRILTLGGVTIGMVHGWGEGIDLQERVGEAFSELPDILLFGHSHRPLIAKIGETLLVNPGSPFSPRSSKFGSVALIELAETEIEKEMKREIKAEIKELTP
jgi:putative phosphoesterase